MIPCACCQWNPNWLAQTWQMATCQNHGFHVHGLQDPKPPSCFVIFVCSLFTPNPWLFRFIKFLVTFFQEWWSTSSTFVTPSPLGRTLMRNWRTCFTKSCTGSKPKWEIRLGLNFLTSSQFLSRRGWQPNTVSSGRLQFISLCEKNIRNDDIGKTKLFFPLHPLFLSLSLSRTASNVFLIEKIKLHVIVELFSRRNSNLQPLTAT